MVGGELELEAEGQEPPEQEAYALVGLWAQPQLGEHVGDEGHQNARADDHRADQVDDRDEHGDDLTSELLHDVVLPSPRSGPLPAPSTADDEPQRPTAA